MQGIKLVKRTAKGNRTLDFSPPRKIPVKTKVGSPTYKKGSIDPFFFPGGAGIYGRPDFSNEFGRRGKETRGLTKGPAASVVWNGYAARRRSRFAVFASPYAKKAVDTLVNNAVGSGFHVISDAPDPEFKNEIEDLFKRWSRKADTTGAQNFEGLTSTVYRSSIEGGDCFVRMRVRRATDDLPVPLQLQVIEAEQVPLHKNETVGAAGGNQIIAGIQFDTFGKPVFYHMYPNHPGEFFDFTKINTDTVKIPAESVLHVHEVKRPNDVRGMPALSQVLIKLSDYDRYLDAELQRKKVSAMIGGFIKEPIDQSAANPFNTTRPEDREEIDIEAFETGEFAILPPGFEVQFIAPEDVGANFAVFIKQQLATVAASLGLTMEQLTGNLENVSDRTLRAALLEFKRMIQAVQRNVIAHQFLIPVYERFVDLAVMSGAITLPAGMTIEDAKRVRFVPQPWQHLHPQQEINAEKAEIRAGLKTRTEALIERGKDPIEFDRQVAEERKREKELELVYDTNPNDLSGAGVAHSFDPVERDVNEALGGEGMDAGSETPRESDEELDDDSEIDNNSSDNGES